MNGQWNVLIDLLLLVTLIALILMGFISRLRRIMLVIESHILLVVIANTMALEQLYTSNN